MILTNFAKILTKNDIKINQAYVGILIILSTYSNNF